MQDDVANIENNIVVIQNDVADIQNNMVIIQNDITDIKQILNESIAEEFLFGMYELLRNLIEPTIWKFQIYQQKRNKKQKSKRVENEKE